MGTGHSDSSAWLMLRTLAAKAAKCRPPPFQVYGEGYRPGHRPIVLGYAGKPILSVTLRVDHRVKPTDDPDHHRE
jgi:ABC-type thiamine transport system substrate-binding protein